MSKDRSDLLLQDEFEVFDLDKIGRRGLSLALS